MRRVIVIVLVPILFTVLANLEAACGGDTNCGKLTKLCKPNGVDCICALECSSNNDCLSDQYCDTEHKTCIPLAWACPADGTKIVISGRSCP